MNDVYITAPIPESERLTEEQKIERDLEDILSLDPRGGDLGLDDAIRSMPQGRDVQDFFRERDRGAQRRQIPRLYDRMGERRTDVDRSSRVTGSRAFAFDYSGVSGAPALMVLADTLRGGGRKQWMWHLPHQKDYRVRLDGQSFTVTYPDAVMRVTLVTSSPVTLRWMENTPMTFIYRGGSRRGDMETRTYQFIAAETPEKDVDIVAVVTLQRRDPPAVEVSGEGENAVITVGSQTIRYRDGHILLGEPPSPLAVADAP